MGVIAWRGKLIESCQVGSLMRLLR